MKAITLRLPVEMHDALVQIARANGTTVTDEVRYAIDAHIERRKADPEFQRHLRERIDALQRLAS